jgi:hypothetical protein
MRIPKSRIAVAILLAVFVFAGCDQPTNSDSGNNKTPATEKEYLNPNLVVATVTVAVLDGEAKPVTGATVTYGTGLHPDLSDYLAGRSIDSRAINTPTTLNGLVELKIEAPGYYDETYESGMDYLAHIPILVTKPGFTTRYTSILVPTIKQVRQWIGEYELPVKDGYTKTVTTTDGELAGTTVTITYENVPMGCWHISLHLPMPVVLYEKKGTLSGTLLLKQNQQADDTTAVPLANANVRFITNMIGGMDGAELYEIVAETTTDTAGQYTMTGVPATIIHEPGVNGLGDYFYVMALVPTSTTVTGLDENTPAATAWRGFDVPPSDLRGLTVISQPYTLVAELNPVIIGWTPYSSLGAEMNPGTLTTRTPVTIKFNKPMNTNRSTNVRISESGTPDIDLSYYYAPAISWNSAGTELTLTPAVPFKKGTTVKVVLVEFFDTEGVKLGENSTSFVVQPGIEYRSSSYQDAVGMNHPLELEANPTIYFNMAPASFNPSKTSLREMSSDVTPTVVLTVGCDISIDAVNMALVFNPTVPLKPNTRYSAIYEVSSGILGDTLLTNATGIDFRTKVATVPTLIASNVYKYGWTPEDKFPIADNITLRFDAPITTLRTNTVKLFQQLGETQTPASDKVAEVVWSLDPADSTGKTILINPVQNLIYGAKYYVQYSVFGSTLDETGSGTLTTGTFTAYKPDSPMLVQSNIWQYESKDPRTDFGIVEAIVLTFDLPVADATPYMYEISLFEGAAVSGGSLVPFATGAAGISWNTGKTTVTLTPEMSLKYNTQYSLSYKVYSGYYTEAPTEVSVNAAFRTASAAKLATPVVLKDDTTKYIADAAKTFNNRNKYNHGEGTLYATFSYVANADTYDWQYRYEGDYTWKTGGSLLTSALTLTSGTGVYLASLVLPTEPAETIEANRTLSVRVKARDAVAPLSGALDSDWATPLVFTDTQSPSALASTTDSLDGVDVNSFTAGEAGVASPNFSVTIDNNTQVDQYYKVTFGLANGEPMQTLTVADFIPQGTPQLLSIVYVSMTKNAFGQNTACTVLIKASRHASTNPAGEYRVPVKDAAGNGFDNGNTGTPAAIDTVIRIIIN